MCACLHRNVECVCVWVCACVGMLSVRVGVCLCRNVVCVCEFVCACNI